MSKGKFEPGKLVLLTNCWCREVNYLKGSVQTLGRVHDGISSRTGLPVWYFEPNITWSKGDVTWAQNDMILIHPDETPEQSIDAMRLLTSSPNKQEQKA